MSKVPREGKSEIDQSANIQRRNGLMTSSPLANYTLPGVINYLTSEFTHLERFKIIADLEKTEMSYKIAMLEGRIQALEYSNDQKQQRIDFLERDNMVLKYNREVSYTSSGSDNPPLKINEAPDIDAVSIKQLREKLSQSMHEISALLRAPTNIGQDILHKAHPEHSTFLETLFQNSDPPQNISAKEVLKNGRQSFPSSEQNSTVARFFELDSGSEQFSPDVDLDFDRHLAIESDVETIIEENMPVSFGSSMDLTTVAVQNSLLPPPVVLLKDGIDFDDGRISVSSGGTDFTIRVGDVKCRCQCDPALEVREILGMHVLRAKPSPTLVLVVYKDGRTVCNSVRDDESVQIPIISTDIIPQQTRVVAGTPGLWCLVLNLSNVTDENKTFIQTIQLSEQSNIILAGIVANFTRKQIMSSLSGILDMQFLDAEYIEPRVNNSRGSKNNRSKSKHMESVSLRLVFDVKRNRNSVKLVFDTVKAHSTIRK